MLVPIDDPADPFCDVTGIDGWSMNSSDKSEKGHALSVVSPWIFEISVSECVTSAEKKKKQSKKNFKQHKKDENYNSLF